MCWRLCYPGCPVPVRFARPSQLSSSGQLRKAETILIQALQAGDIGVLSTPEYEFAIPSAFRFYQAARDGEAEHNLKILLPSWPDG